MKIERLEQAVEGLRRMHPHDGRYSFYRAGDSRYSQVKKPPKPATFVSHVIGKSMIGAVGGDDDGMTNCVGIDLDAHTINQDPTTAVKRFLAAAMAWDIPIIAHTSKSGKGYHVRTLFSDKIPVHRARTLYLCLSDAAQILNDSSLDKVWPPSTGYGILALPLQLHFVRKNGGGLALDPGSLEPYKLDEQIDVLIETPGMNGYEVAACLSAMGVTSDEMSVRISGTHRGLGRGDGSRDSIPLEGVDGGLRYMFERCLAFRRLDEEPMNVKYPFWFALMTNARPFIGGREVMNEYRKVLRVVDPDSRKYHEKEFAASWKSISGGPRMCSNLDPHWRCPLLGHCQVRSPAALPMWLKKNGRIDPEMDENFHLPIIQ